MVKKNIGVYTLEEQKKIKETKIIIFGLGGVGGTQSVLLARTGVEHLSGVDPDFFELSNVNRQSLAFRSTLNQDKSKVTKQYLKDINPDLKGTFYTCRVDESNVEELIGENQLVIEALDDMPSRIIVHRAARKLGIPSVAMSGSPPHRGFVSTFLPDGIDYETALSIPTHGKSISSPEVQNFVQDLKKKRALYSVTKGAPEQWAEDFCQNKAGWIITSVRANLIASLSCHEALQIIIGRKPLAVAPKGILIDLDELTHPVSVQCPKNGVWDSTKL